MYIKYKLFGFITLYRVATNKEVADYVHTTMRKDALLTQALNEMGYKGNK